MARTASSRTTATEPSSAAFSDQERAAMHEVVAEAKRARTRTTAAEKAAGDLADTIARIEGFEEPDRSIAGRIHELATAQGLAPRLWYGMPAWTRGGKLVLFFKDRAKFSSRYATLGFEESAALDDGAMWATSFALAEPTEADWDRIAELVARAAG